MESMIPAPKSSETDSHESHTASRSARRTPKNATHAPKNATRAPKNATRAPKNTTRAPKNATRAPKNTDVAAQDVGADADDAFLAAERAGASPEDAPRVKRIPLVAPSRTGRTVVDLGVAVDRAEVRLQLAWRYRDVLDVALPQRPPFHDHAWSAVAKLRGEGAGEGAGDGTGGASAALDALLEEVTVLRNAVEFTTRPGDPAREALRFGTTLRATAGLVDVAAQVIAGARAVQARFPALTDEVIGDAERALAAARAKVSGSRKERVGEAVARIDGADDRQLALDVLLDAIDHLRAAARTRLHKTRPRLCEALCAPLERAKPRAASEEKDGEEKGGEEKDGEGKGGG